ncbi:MAG: alpha/beta hydrolase [Verrucomicrobiae bacterium]|nr:alpha/beta hydrolase [Verrucomicrobiae bacterium]
MKNLLILSLAFLLLPSAFLLAQEPEVRIYKKVDGRELAVHIFKPEKQTSLSPAVVWYHGGGWREGKAGQFFEHGKILTKFGVVSISVDYRGYAGDAENRDIVRCIEDAKSAFRWVRAHAGDLKIDPDKIAVGGGSAGGHLAAAIATLPGHNAPGDDMNIPLNPCLQLLFNPALDPTHYIVNKDASPLAAVHEGIPPAIIFHGKDDTTVPITQAYDYQRAMFKVGAECQVNAYAGQTHSFFNYRSGANPYYYKTVGDMIVFLDNQGFLPQPKK